MQLRLLPSVLIAVSTMTTTAALHLPATLQGAWIQSTSIRAAAPSWLHPHRGGSEVTTRSQPRSSQRKFCSALASTLTPPATTPLEEESVQIIESILTSTATAAAAKAVGQQLQSLGKVIATGSIVKQFAGGMVAVHLNDDIEDDDDEEEETVNGNIAFLVKGLPASATSSRAKGTTAAASGDLQGKLVSFANGSTGIVVAHRPPVIFIHTSTAPSAGAAATHKNKQDHAIPMVKVHSNIASVHVSPKQRCTNLYGESFFDDAKDHHQADESTFQRAIFAAIPQVKDIALINHPMLTGVTMMDVLAPIGRGQNMLMVGHDLKAMRGYMADFVKQQLESPSANMSRPVQCIYACTGADHHAVRDELQARGLVEKLHMIVPQWPVGSDPHDETSQSAQAVAIACAACAMAEAYALEQGHHALVIIDTIDPLKHFWDATTRVLVDVFGVDAVVKADREGGASSEMRGFYSSLIQRSAQYSARKGGGSVTLVLLTTIPRMHHADDDDDDSGAEHVFQEQDFEQSNPKIKERIQLLVKQRIPLTAANLRRINIPIPSDSEGKRRLILQHVDDLMSMSDGQIWLDERLEMAQQQQQPPMDPQRSVTRIGIGADTASRADAPALRRVAEGLRLILSQAASMEGAEPTAASIRQLRRQQALLLAMHQQAGEGGRHLSQSCVALLAAMEGALDRAIDQGALAGTVAGEGIVQGLLRHAQKHAPEAMAEIDTTLDMSDSVRATLVDTIEAYFARQNQQ